MEQARIGLNIEVARNKKVFLWARGQTLLYSYEGRIHPSCDLQTFDAMIAAAAVSFGFTVFRVRRAATPADAHFKVVFEEQDEEDDEGKVTLAEAFFPKAFKRGIPTPRPELRVFPAFWEDDATERHVTLCHEFGHIFGLRHFQAADEDNRFVQHGTDSETTVMNQGGVTEVDRTDLRSLYEGAWSGQLTMLGSHRIAFVSVGSYAALSAGNAGNAANRIMTRVYRPPRARGGCECVLV